jgi:hypothetical protein
LHLTEEGVFSFRCHPGVSCFNRCCHHLNLFLYPYDVIRLKSRLGMESGEFLDRYVDVVLREGMYFPDVLLTMSESTTHPCPFLTGEGCGVYSDRPDACRMFPLEMGIRLEGEAGGGTPLYFYRPPDFCMGQFEDREWNPGTWMQDQCAQMHNAMTIEWSETYRLFAVDPWKGEGPNGPRGKMAFMSAYNIDEFRRFVTGSTFRKRYKIPSAAWNRAQTDDVQMLRIGLAWIRRFLFDLPTPLIQIRR